MAHAIRQAQEEAYLEPRHTDRCRTLVDRAALLQRIGGGGIVAEVGAGAGDFSKLIWEVCRPVRLHLIDSWASDRYRGGKQRVHAMFAGPIGAGRVVVHEGPSIVRLASLADASLDWVYIDTDHSYGLTRRELACAAEKVRPGGRVAGHDFCAGNVRRGIPYGVIPACHRFCAEQGWGYEFLTLEKSGHFSFCLKRLEDF